jgi:hypothetical protein
MPSDFAYKLLCFNYMVPSESLFTGQPCTLNDGVPALPPNGCRRAWIITGDRWACVLGFSICSFIQTLDEFLGRDTLLLR